jgi:serine/threonine protein kinase
MAWASGQKLQGGKYTIEQELGEGGFGITYRARDNNGQKVVIKTLNETVQRRADFAKFQQDFLNEALRLARCSHPHIVRVDEVIQEEQRVHPDFANVFSGVMMGRDLQPCLNCVLANLGCTRSNCGA